MDRPAARYAVKSDCADADFWAGDDFGGAENGSDCADAMEINAILTMDAAVMVLWDLSDRSHILCREHLPQESNQQ